MVEVLEAGPEVAGVVTACWTALLVQQWIEREFGVLYNQHYVCALLHDLGYSYHKSAFFSNHLHPDAPPAVVGENVACDPALGLGLERVESVRRRGQFCAVGLAGLHLSPPRSATRG